MQYVKVPLCNLPVHLCCLEDASIVFVRAARNFKTVIDLKYTDSKVEGVSAIFDNESFEIDGIKYLYDFPYKYKNDEVLLNWLKKQDL